MAEVAERDAAERSTERRAVARDLVDLPLDDLGLLRVAVVDVLLGGERLLRAVERGDGAGLIHLPLGVFTGVVKTTRTVAATSEPDLFTLFASTKTGLPLDVVPIWVHFFCACALAAAGRSVISAMEKAAMRMLVSG